MFLCLLITFYLFQSCECDPIGSISCNQSSGQCACKEGVGGDNCEHCDVAHFNYSLSGCMPCECGLGSTNSSCNDLGQCHCSVSQQCIPSRMLITYIITLIGWCDWLEMYSLLRRFSFTLFARLYCLLLF